MLLHRLTLSRNVFLFIKYIMRNFQVQGASKRMLLVVLTMIVIIFFCNNTSSILAFALTQRVSSCCFFFTRFVLPTLTCCKYVFVITWRFNQKLRIPLPTNFTLLLFPSTKQHKRCSLVLYLKRFVLFLCILFLYTPAAGCRPSDRLNI